MNLSGIPRRSVLGRVLRAPLRLIPPGTVLPVLQGRLRGARWIVGAGTHGCWLGSYEYGKRRLFERLVRPGQVVWDVGANAGFYTLLASRLVGSTGSVVAIEPLPRNLSYLRRHLELNRPPTDPTPTGGAASSSATTATRCRRSMPPTSTPPASCWRPPRPRRDPPRSVWRPSAGDAAGGDDALTERR